MKKVLALYCRTYSGDMERFRVLLDSVGRYNEDRLPFYVEVPLSDFEVFYALVRDFVGEDFKGSVRVIASQDSKYEGLGGSLVQQVDKLSFGLKGYCDVYVVLDSDSYFIREFREGDFVHGSGVPYVVMHEERGFFEWLQVGGVKYPVKDSFESHCRRVSDYLEMGGGRVFYSFGPSPVIISSDVVFKMFQWLVSRGSSFESLILMVPSEYTWYGNFLLKEKIHEIYPREPLFKCFHYSEQYADAKERGYTEEQYKEIYMGIVLQSNWGAPLRY